MYTSLDVPKHPLLPTYSVVICLGGHYKILLLISVFKKITSYERSTMNFVGVSKIRPLLPFYSQNIKLLWLQLH